MRTRKQEVQRMNGAATAEQPSQPSPKLDAALLTVTGDQAKIEGKFQIADSLHIECEIGGELDIGGTMVIGERGIVHADVRTVDALIMGSYEGNLIATGNVEIAATGRVIGNLETDSLVIERGGFFNGTVERLEGTDQARPAATARRIAVDAAEAGNGAAATNGHAGGNGSANGNSDRAHAKASTDEASNGTNGSRGRLEPEAFLEGSAAAANAS